LLTGSEFDAARELLKTGHEVTLSCPQKVCLSGDYGDMHPGGETFTASLSTRARLVLRRTPRPSRISIHDGPDSRPDEWPLIRTFRWRLWELDKQQQLDSAYEVDVVPTEYINLGLGSSGAGSVLLAAALAIIDGSTLTDTDLIEAAHEFETSTADFECGPQDHAASVLGGLNLISYPSLAVTRMTDLAAWSAFTFWTTGQPRHAGDVIPITVERHTGRVWATKAVIVRTLVAAFEAKDRAGITECVRRESVIQVELGMLTDRQQELAELATTFGCAAKVSGAGGGGVLVFATPDDDRTAKLRRELDREGLHELALQVGPQGFSVDDSPG
jgi:mevalonate kinase